MTYFKFEGNDESNPNDCTEISSQEAQNNTNITSDVSENLPEPKEEDRVVFDPQANANFQTTFQKQHQPSEEELKEFTSIQRLSYVALLAAVVSYFIGGVPLSIVALIMSLISYRTIDKNLKNENNAMKDQWRQSMRLVQIALGLSAGGIVLNALSTYLLLNVLQDTGYANLFSSGSSSPSTSAWG